MAVKRHFTVPGLLLAVVLCGLAHADNALEQWRGKAGGIRRLLENDVPRAYAEVQRLHAELPADATPSDRVRLLNLLARVENYQGETDSSTAHAQQAFDLAKQHEDKAGQAEADITIALDAINRGDIDAMVAADTHSLAILDGVDRPDLLAEAMLRASMMYTRMEMPEESVAIAVQAMEIARRGNDDWVLTYAYQGMAVAYDQNGRYAEARDNYVEMLKHAQAVHSKVLEGNALIGMGLMLNHLGDHQGGERLIRSALDLYREVGAPFYIARNLFALAENMRKQGRFVEALPLLDQAVALYRQRSNKIGLWWTLYQRSENYLDLGKVAQADADAKEAYRLAEEIKFPVYLGKSARRLSSIAAARNDYGQAYRLSVEAEKLSTKAAGDNAGKRMLELTQRYETESKQREIDKLNRRNQQQATELAHRALEQRWLWTVFGGSVIMLTGTAFFLIRLRRSHRRLEALNSEVLQAKNKLQATLDTIPDLMFEVGLDGRYYDCHSPQPELLVAPISVLLTKTVSDVMPADAASVCLETLYEAHRHGLSLGKQLLLPLPHGDFWFELSVAQKPGEAGEEPRFIVLSRDITERKHLEAQALQREQEFRVLVENSTDLIFRYDKDCRRIYANPAVVKLVGKSSDALLNATPSEAKILSTDEADKLLRMIRQVLATGLPAESEVECLDSDGQLHYFHNRYAPEFNAHGEVVGVISIARDITERKHAVEILAAREREFRTLAENIPDHIIRYDDQARKIFMNTATARLMGIDPGALLGQTPEQTPIETRTMQIDAFAEKLKRVLATGDPQELEVSLRHAERGMQIHNVKFVAEHDEQGKIVGALMVGRDITAQKAAENILKESEQRYREIFENVSDSLYLVEVLPEGRFRNLAFNFAFEQSTGIAREQLIGRYVGEASTEKSITDENANILIDKYRRCIAAGSSIEEETVLDLPSGRRHFHSTLIPLYDGAGQICRILGIAHDITELKRAERKFRNLAENAPDNICRYDRQGRVVYLNPHLEATLGMKTSEVLGKTSLQVYPDGRFTGYHAKLIKVVETGKADQMEIELPDIGSGVSFQHVRLVAERDAGEIVGVLAIGRDITERKRAEEQIQALNFSLEQRVLERTDELRQQTRYLRTIIDTLPLLVWLKDTECRFMMVNQPTADSCRLSIGEMVGKTDSDLWPRELAEAYMAEDREVMTTRRRKIVEEPAKINGSVWIEIDKVPVLDDDGSVLGTVGVARNISERKAMEAARERALAEAVRLVRLRSDFMARMSHELRTPLNGILGYAQILLRENRLNERQSTMLNVIQQSGEHLLNLINDILDFAKIEAGKQKLSLRNVRLPSFLRNLAGIVSVRAEQKHLAFVCDIAADMPEVIRADETRLRQVLLNLLSNAVKYSERGQISFRVAAPEPGRLRFEIRDSGIGIDAGQLESIFQPFEQVAEGPHGIGGTGLGLAISRELVRLMGSDIQVSSRLGEGSSFWFDLEVAIVRGGAEAALDEREVVGYQGSRRRVLVVDDLDANRALLIDMLSHLGFETVEASSGPACLAMAETQAPDLILIDMSMPEMDGLETTRHLRQLPGLAQMPIIAISAGSGGNDFDDIMDAGVNAFLSKPIDMNKLIAHIVGLLKIDWIYAQEAQPTPRYTADQTLDVPPPEEMAVLHRLAREGNMRDIIRQAEYLPALDERYRPFAEQLRALAQGYQSKAVLDLVEHYHHCNQTPP